MIALKYTFSEKRQFSKSPIYFKSVDSVDSKMITGTKREIMSKGILDLKLNIEYIYSIQFWNECMNISKGFKACYESCLFSVSF